MPQVDMEECTTATRDFRVDCGMEQALLVLHLTEHLPCCQIWQTCLVKLPAVVTQGNGPALKSA